MKSRPSPNAGKPCVVCGGYIVEERSLLFPGIGGLVRPAKPPTVMVFYATDRNRTQSTDPSNFYGTQRSEVTYGTCEVSIPRVHKMGKVESPSPWRLEFAANPEKHIHLVNVIQIAKTEYFTKLKDKIKAFPDKNLLIFVHGYNVSFADAAKRTAQISYDLGFQGASIFYSWPSQGTWQGYLVDETNIEWAQGNLRRFLDDILVSTQAESIYLIAHSMGNRALTSAFSSLIFDQPKQKTRFREIILTAPDIDSDVFRRDIAPPLVQEKSSITLYVSSEDKALYASKFFHGYSRAGDISDGIVIVSGIDTIDVTGIDTSFFNHAYFAEARSILADIFYLIRHGRRQEYRFALEPIDTEGGRYWRFKR